MHGYVRPKLKHLTIQGLKSIEMRDPARSTVGERSVYPCASLEVEEVKYDIRSLGWEECPIGSILAVGSSADGEEKERERKRKREDVPAVVVLEAEEPISASSEMAAIEEKKEGLLMRTTRRRKKKPVAFESPEMKKKKRMVKKKARKMKSISKALVVM